MSKYTINSLILDNYRSYVKETLINFGSQITLIFGKGSVNEETAKRWSKRDKYGRSKK